MTYTPDDARAYVASVRWQFASTMPRIPHWYTIRKWRPELDNAFVAFVRHVRSAGMRMDWPDPPAKPLYRNQYLLLDAGSTGRWATRTPDSFRRSRRRRPPP
jgi:hypothetical protein